MKSMLLPCLFVFVHFFSFSQRWEFEEGEVDSLQIYSPEKQSYTFYLEAGSQGLFINKTEVVWLPSIEIKIINNTGKTIVNDFREHDGHLMWYRTNWKRIVEPGEEMVSVSKWLSMNSIAHVNVSKGIKFSYTIDSIPHNFELKVKGEFLADVEEQKRITDKNKSKSVSIMEPKSEPFLPQKPEPKVVKQPHVVHTEPEPRVFYNPIQVVKKKSFYGGQEINKTTRKGFKTGRWVYLYENNGEKSQEFYSGKDYHWDSAYFYYANTRTLERKMYHIKLSDTAVMKQEFNEQGRLYKTYFWNGEERLEPTSRAFYPSGQLRSVTYPSPNPRTLDYYPSGALQKRTSYTFEGKADSIHYYFESGTLQKVEVLDIREKPRRRNTYDKNGDQLSSEDLYQRNTVSWKYLSKTDSLYVVERYYNGKHSWTDSGTYRNNDLWNGIRISTQGGIYSLPKVFSNGRENGFYYQDEWVNQRDSLHKVGKWLTLFNSGSIKEFSMFTNGKCDSTYHFYENGAVQSIVYPSGPHSPQRRYKQHFYEDGSIQFIEGGFAEDTVWVSFYNGGAIEKMKRRNGFIYNFQEGNACKYVITRPKIFKERQRNDRNDINDLYYLNRHYQPTGYGPIEDHYKNCKLYKRINSRYYRVDGIEGSESQANSYTIDIGSFLNDELNNGKREYYDKKSQLLRTVKVQNGKEI